VSKSGFGIWGMKQFV